MTTQSHFTKATKSIAPKPRKLLRIVLLIVGSLLVIDCLVLFSLLKFNFGTIVPFFIGLIFLVHGLYWQKIQAFIEHNKTHSKWLKLAWRGCWLLFSLWLASFLLFVATLLWQIYHQPSLTNNSDGIKAVIVLGAGVNGDKPTPTLANRLDTASSVLQTQPTALAVTAGGVGIGREHSEAYVMANYLQDKHQIPLASIAQEGKSTSTEENLAFSKAILQQHNIDPTTDSIVIVTNDFHSIRATAIAKRQGYGNVIAVSSSTPISIRFNAWFREYFAFVSGWLLDEY